MMDYAEAILVTNDFNSRSFTPDSMVSIVTEEDSTDSRPSSDRDQGIANQAVETSEESEGSTPSYMPAIEDLEEAVTTEGRPTRAESEITNTSEPPAYSDSGSTDSQCCLRGRSCSSFNKRNLCKICFVWIVTLAISLSLAVALKVAVFNSYTFHASPSDQRELHKFSTTYFCRSVEITSTSTFGTFLLLFPPQIDDSNPDSFQTTMNVRISPGNFQYWGFYLLEGSTLILIVCTENTSDNFELLIFEGEDNFENFEDGCFDGSCPYMQSQALYSNSCDSQPNKTRVTMEITSTNDYYIVLSARNTPDTVSATIDINLLKSVYTLSAIGESVCFSQKTCMLTGTASTYGVLFIEPDNSAYNSFNEVKCLADAETFLFMFLVIPIMIACVISVSMVLKTRGQQDDSSTQTSTSRTRRRSRLYSGPPTYEELFHEENRNFPSTGITMEPPPPYPGEGEGPTVTEHNDSTNDGGQNTDQQNLSGDATNGE